MSVTFEKALLRKKYKTKVVGEKLADLCGKIVKENQSKISNAVLTTDRRRFDRNISKISPKGQEKRIRLPDVSNVIRRSPVLIKAADQGNMMSRTLRERLRKDLKESMLEANITTKSGKVNKNIARKMEKKIRQTFKDYVRKTPGYDMPANIHTIAVTETRSAINTIRDEYVREVNKETSNEYEIKKAWVHNDSLSKVGRPRHEQLSREKPIPLDARFNVNGHMALRPHDPILPAEEFIGCNCELEYVWIKKTVKKI